MLSDHTLSAVLASDSYLGLPPEDQQTVVVKWHQQKIAELRERHGDAFQPSMLLEKSAEVLGTSVPAPDAMTTGGELGKIQPLPVPITAGQGVFGARAIRDQLREPSAPTQERRPFELPKEPIRLQLPETIEAEYEDKPPEMKVGPFVPAPPSPKPYKRGMVDQAKRTWDAAASRADVGRQGLKALVSGDKEALRKVWEYDDIVKQQEVVSATASGLPKPIMATIGSAQQMGEAYTFAIPSAVLGGKAGSTVALTAHYGTVEAGQMYIDMTKRGVDPDVARPVAAVGGAVFGLIESAVDAVLPGSADAAIAKGTAKQSFKNFALDFAKTVAVEAGIEEVAQSFTESAADNIATALSPHISEDAYIPLRESLKRGIVAGQEAIIPAALLVGGGMTAKAASDKMLGPQQTMREDREDQEQTERLAAPSEPETRAQEVDGGIPIPKAQTQEGFVFTPGAIEKAINRARADEERAAQPLKPSVPKTEMPDAEARNALVKFGVPAKTVARLRGDEVQRLLNDEEALRAIAKTPEAPQHTPSPESPVTQRQFTTALRQIADAMEGKSPVPAPPDTALPESAPPPPDVRQAEAEPATVAEKPVAPTVDEAYDAARESASAATREFRKAQQDYRARKLGDDAFLAAKAAHDKAMADFDAAETAFIDTKNAADIAPKPPPKPRRRLPEAVRPGGQAIPAKKVTPAPAQRAETPAPTEARVPAREESDLPSSPAKLPPEPESSASKPSRARHRKLPRSVLPGGQAATQETTDRTVKPVITGSAKKKTVKTPLPAQIEKTITNEQAKPLLLAEFQSAFEQAKPASEASDEAKAINFAMQGGRTAVSKKSQRSELLAEAKRVYGTITVEIPGDGKFTIGNSKEHIADFMKRVKTRLPTSTQALPKPASLPKATPEQLAVLKKEAELADAQLAAEGKFPTTAARVVAKLESARETLRKKNRGRMNDITTGVPVAMLDAAITVSIGAIKAGQSVAQAIDAAVQYIRDTRGELFNRRQERAFRRNMEEMMREAGKLPPELPKKDMSTPPPLPGPATEIESSMATPERDLEMGEGRRRERGVVSRVPSGEDIEPQTYKQESMREVFNPIMDSLEANPDTAAETEEAAMNNPIVTTFQAARAAALIAHYQNIGNTEGAARVTDRADKFMRQAGRVSNLAKLIEGLKNGRKWANKMNEWFDERGVDISKEDRAELRRAFDDVVQMPNGAEKEQAISDLVLEIASMADLTWEEWLDAMRYTNTLCGVRTTMRNMFQNTMAIGLTYPLELAAQKKSVGTYYRNLFGKLSDAKDAAIDVWNGVQKDVDSKYIDTGRKSVFTEALHRRGPRNKMAKQWWKINNLVGPFLEAQDVLFSHAFTTAEMLRKLEDGEITKLATEIQQKNEEYTDEAALEAALAQTEQETQKDARRLLVRRPIGSATSEDAWLVQMLDKLGEGLEGLRTPPQRDAAGKVKKGAKFAQIAAKLSILFLRTPISVIQGDIEYSLLGLVGGKLTTKRKAQAALGGLASMIGLAFAMAGKTDAEPPEDKDEREKWYAAGHRPWSIRIGSRAIPLAYFNLLALSLGMPMVIVDRLRNPRYASQKPLRKALSISLGISKMAIAELPLQTLNEGMALFSGQETYREDMTIQKFAGGMAGQFVPFQGFLRDMANLFDPNYHKAKSAKQRIQKGLPFWSKKMPPILLPPLYEGAKPETAQKPWSQYLPYTFGIEDKRYQPMLKERQDLIRLRRTNDKRIDDMAAEVKDGETSDETLIDYVESQDKDEAGRLKSRLKTKHPEIELEFESSSRSRRRPTAFRQESKKRLKRLRNQLP